jgi:DNA-binding transcriptional regulator YiaG
MGDTTGADLRAARERAGLSQQAVADALQLSRQTIVTWEGKAVVPPVKAERYLRVVRELASSAN